jgi:hypothetical protein
MHPILGESSHSEQAQMSSAQHIAGTEFLVRTGGLATPNRPTTERQSEPGTQGNSPFGE